MLAKIILFFIIVPTTELTLLLRLSDVVGAKYTIGLIILTGIIGGYLARWQGVRTLFKLRDQMGKGQFPTEALADGGMILVAGALLLTPGILTDIFGFSLLAPFCRPLYRKLLMKWFKKNVRVGNIHVQSAQNPPTSAGGSPVNSDQVIDAEVVTRSDSST